MLGSTQHSPSGFALEVGVDYLAPGGAGDAANVRVVHNGARDADLEITKGVEMRPRAISGTIAPGGGSDVRSKAERDEADLPTLTAHRQDDRPNRTPPKACLADAPP